MFRTLLILFFLAKMTAEIKPKEQIWVEKIVEFNELVQAKHNSDLEWFNLQKAHNIEEPEGDDEEETRIWERTLLTLFKERKTMCDNYDEKFKEMKEWILENGKKKEGFSDWMLVQQTIQLHCHLISDMCDDLKLKFGILNGQVSEEQHMALCGLWGVFDFGYAEFVAK